MNPTCSISGCSKKATLYCDCVSSSVFLCLGHLTLHTMNPGDHNPKKIQDLAQAPSKVQPKAFQGFVKCNSKFCQGLSKFFCNCTQVSICVNCLDTHILENPRITHNIEARYLERPSYEDTIHPLDVFLHRAQCDSSTINKMKMKNITMREILCWDMRKLSGMTEALGLNSTMKYLLWEEINYIRIVTEKTHLKNEYLARLVFGLKENEEAETLSIDGTSK